MGKCKDWYDDRNSNVAASMVILLAGCLWGTMGLWVRRFSQEGVSALEILAIRAAVTSILMGIFLSIYNRKLLLIKWKDLWCFFGTGVCSIVFFGYCYNVTIVQTSLSTAAILLYTAPVFVMILSRILFGEKLSAGKIAALLLAFSGCVCVTGIAGGEQTLSMMGILTGLGSGFGYALYSVFGRFALERDYHPFTVTFYTFVCGLIALAFLADWKAVCTFAIGKPGNLLYCIIYGIITTVLPYIFYTLGLSYVENSRASIIATIEPVVATLLGIAVFGERLTLMSGAGVVMVLGAILLLNII